MVVNDNACKQDKRGAPESIASKPAPTGIALSVLRYSTRTRSLVGAGLPAMEVNDDACNLDKHGALESIASKPAPTGEGHAVFL